MKTNYLFIQRDSDIRQVRQHFSEWYPYLKINFFHSLKDKKEKNAVGIVFRDTVKLNEINPLFNGGNMKISDEMSILEFEQEFSRQFNISVQVSRKSGNLWLDTIKTNQWTLKEQNDHGEAISTESKQKNYFRGN